MPALMLGIPSGAGTAVLLGGLILVGVTPGPIMVENDPDLILVIAWSLALANVLGTTICFLLTKQIAKVTAIKPGRLVPFLFVAVVMSAFQATQKPGDLVLLLVFGAFGWLLTIAGWPRAPFLIGFVLGPAAERYLWISMSRFDLAWLGRPGVIVIGLLVVAVAVLAVRSRGSKRPGPPDQTSHALAGARGGPPESTGSRQKGGEE